jgi:hypothetical protein
MNQDDARTEDVSCAVEFCTMLITVLNDKTILIFFDELYFEIACLKLLNSYKKTIKSSSFCACNIIHAHKGLIK